MKLHQNMWYEYLAKTIFYVEMRNFKQLQIGSSCTKRDVKELSICLIFLIFNSVNLWYLKLWLFDIIHRFTYKQIEISGCNHTGGPNNLDLWRMLRSGIYFLKTSSFIFIRRTDMNELKVRVEEEETKFDSRISECNKNLGVCKDELIIQERRK